MDDHRSAAGIVVALAACMLWGCAGGSSGKPLAGPPTISSLALDVTSAPQAVGTTPVQVSLQFADPGAELTSVTVTVLDASGNQVSVITSQLSGKGGQTSGAVTETAQVAAATPGFFTIQVYVTDASGAKSNNLSAPLQIVPSASMAAIVAATGPSPSSLTVGNGTLYWFETGEDALKSVPIGGGTPKVLATRMVDPIWLGFAGSDVIWTDFRAPQGPSCPGTVPKLVIKRTTAIGNTTVLATVDGCGVGLANPVLVGTTLYWTSSDASQETINATPLDGGATTVVATSAVGFSQMVASGGNLYWLESSPTTNFMSAIRSVPAAGGSVTTLLSGFNAGVPFFAVDAANVYYTVPTGPNAIDMVDLVALPLSGGAPTTLASGIWPPMRMIATGTHVIWIDRVGDVYSISLAGPAPVVLATVGPGNAGPYDLAFDGNSVIWIEASNVGTTAAQGLIRAVPLAGGAITTLYQSSDIPQQLAIDPALRINWTESNIHGLARIARLGAGNAAQTVADGISSNPPTFVLAAGALIYPDLNRLKSISLSGGLPSTIVVDSWPIGNLASDGLSLVWNDAVNGTLRMAPVAGGAVTVLADATALGANVGSPRAIRVGPDGRAYWIVNVSTGFGLYGPPSLLSAPIDMPTATVMPIATNLGGATDLAVDSTGVYLGSDSGIGPSISNAPLGSAGPLTTIDGIARNLRSLALDAPNLYWFDGMQIAKVPEAGGASVGVLDFDSGPALANFAVDSTSVYFTDPYSHDIRMTPK
jgi:hypothetical protein